MSHSQSFESNQIDVAIAHAHDLAMSGNGIDALRLLHQQRARLVANPASQARFHVVAARASEQTGNMAEAKVHAVEAERHAITHDDVLSLAESLELQGKIALRQRDLAVAVRAFERAIDNWQRAQTRDHKRATQGLSRTLIGISYAKLSSDDATAALNHALAAINNARIGEQTRNLGNALNAAGAIYQRLTTQHHPNYGDDLPITALPPCDDVKLLAYADAGVACCTEAARLAQAAGIEMDALCFDSNAASFENLAGRAETALEKHAAFAAYCRKHQHNYLLASALQMQAWSLRLLGRYGESERALQEALAICQDADARDLTRYVHFDLSATYEHLGKLHQALFHVREFVRLRPALTARGSTQTTIAANSVRDVLNQSNAAPKGAEIVPTRSGEPAQLFRAKAYINAHLRERITVADVARHAGVTPRSLQLVFLRHHAQSPLGFIRDAKLAAAHRFLLQSQHRTLTVAQVAEHWGFDNAGRFSRAYKTLFGRSPKQVLES